MSPKHRRTLTPTPASFQRDTDCCTPGRQAKRQKCGTSNSVVKRNKVGVCCFLPTLCQFSFVYSKKRMNSAGIQMDTDCCTPGRQAKQQKCGTSNSMVKRNKAGASYFLPTLCQFSFVYSNKGMNSPCIQRDTDCCTPVDWQRVKGLKTYGPCPLSRPHFCLKYQAVYNSHQTGLTLIQFH